ncbi:FmdB family zinc ribbon protein [Chloroflexota bacterium]
MPIYTYRCKNCGIQFDQRQKFSDNPLTRCPECSKKSLQKVFQPVGIVFKGSGFYSTDNRSSSAIRTPGSTKSDSAESGDSKEKSGENSSDSSSSSSDDKSSATSASSSSSNSKEK